MPLPSQTDCPISGLIELALDFDPLRSPKVEREFVPLSRVTRCYQAKTPLGPAAWFVQLDDGVVRQIKP